MANIQLKAYKSELCIMFDIKSEIEDLKTICDSIIDSFRANLDSFNKETIVTPRVIVSELYEGVKYKDDPEEENVVQELVKRTGFNKEIIRIIRKAEEEMLDEALSDFKS